MDEAVVDSSVAVKWFVGEEHQEQAHEISRSRRLGQPVLLAPDLIYAKFGSIVWKKHLFQGLPDADAQAALTLFRQVPLAITAPTGLINKAYRLVVTYHRSVYDSLCLALSLRAWCCRTWSGCRIRTKRRFVIV